MLTKHLLSEDIEEANKWLGPRRFETLTLSMLENYYDVNLPSRDIL